MGYFRVLDFQYNSNNLIDSVDTDCGLDPVQRLHAHLLLLLFRGLVVVDQADVGLLEGQLGGEVDEVVVPADLAQNVLQDHLLLHRQPVLEDQHDVLLIRLCRQNKRLISNRKLLALIERRVISVLTVPGTVVPLASRLFGHVELRSKADALLRSRLEEQDRKFPDAAPLAADQLRRLKTNLLDGVLLRTCRRRRCFHAYLTVCVSVTPDM